MNTMQRRSVRQFIVDLKIFGWFIVREIFTALFRDTRNLFVKKWRVLNKNKSIMNFLFFVALIAFIFRLYVVQKVFTILFVFIWLKYEFDSGRWKHKWREERLKKLR